MRKSDPRTLAVDLLERSTCTVQVAAVLFDARGIFAWGWNSAGPDGFGQHAEAHALTRANPKRLSGATVVVAGRRGSAIVPSPPCLGCRKSLERSGVAWYYYEQRWGVWEKAPIWSDPEYLPSPWPTSCSSSSGGCPSLDQIERRLSPTSGTYPNRRRRLRF